jgi:tetratricopeptide (TPR) repeat protein
MGTVTNNLGNGKTSAMNMMQQGRAGEAIPLLQEHCRLNSQDAEAFYLLGSCHGMLGQYPQAITVLQQSLMLQPDMPQTHFALGGAYKMSGEFENAITQFRAATELSPDMVDAEIALADALGTLGDMSEARQHYLKALEIQPGTAAAHSGLGSLAGQMDRHEEALSHFQKAVKCSPKSPQYLCSVAGCMAALGRLSQSRGIYRKALKYVPQYPDALGGLARIHDKAGEYEKVACLVKPLLNQKLYSVPAAMALLGVCKHLSSCDEALAYAEGVLDCRHDIPPHTKRNLHMAIARVLDHLERYDEAFSHFKTGNEITSLNYDAIGHRVATNNLIKVFSRATLLRLPRSRIDTRRPIFIVGMPRSGTSLTEQILASHPEVAAAGELTELGDIMSVLPTELGSSDKWPFCVNEINQGKQDELARRYLDSLKAVSKSARHITDKMPHNFYLLGLIELLFPQAHVIHCQRDPLDICLSIYFQSFLDAHNYARDLFSLGTHYHQYQRLMEHWQHTLSLPILNVQYEDLVSQPEKTVRHMLEFCGLEWNKQCLQFHKLERKVDTASYDQVRQPLHTKSVQRWRHYEQYLDELKQGLDRGH